MPETIRVRPFVDGDLPEVLEVLRLSLGEPPGLKRTRELFAWKHFDNPFGRSLMLVAEEDGRVAGFRAFMRWDLVGPENVLLRCVRAVDTATHPDFQRRGIFRQLTLTGIDLAIEAGLDVIFNTPNPKSGAGYLTMGWSEIGQVGAMVRPRLGLVVRRQQRPWEPGVPTISAGSLTAAAPLLGRQPLGWRTPRTPEYLRWRFGSHPTARYLLSAVEDGIAIGRANTRHGRRELVVSEIGGSGRAVSHLIRVAGPDYAVAWFSPGTPERKSAFWSALIAIPRLRVLTLMFRPLRPLGVDLSWPKWDLALGDLELL